jgi:hypothetical protein
MGEIVLHRVEGAMGMSTDVWKVGNRCPESYSGVGGKRGEDKRLSRLREVEASCPFQHSYSQLLFHNLLTRVIGKLQVVDTSHDAWKVVIGRQRRFVRLSDNGKWWIETTETYKASSDAF